MLHTQPFVALFQRGCERLPETDGDALREWLADRIDDPEVRAWVAVREGRLVGYIIVLAGVSALSPLPWVAAIYAEAPGARSALIGEVGGWLRGLGFDRFRAYNLSGMPDEQWRTIFSQDLDPELKASLYEWRFKD